MEKRKIKRLLSIALLTLGAVLLIMELAELSQSYYIQSIGLISLMSGIFLLNTRIQPKKNSAEEEGFVVTEKKNPE